MVEREKLPYRQSTLGVVVDNEGKFLVVNKMVYQGHQWSFPGGGVDDGETPEMAVMRELVEELGSAQFEIRGQSQNVYQYEWPDEVVETTFTKKGKWFRGQQLTQFWIAYIGDKSELKPADGIRQIKWISRGDLPQHLVFPNQLENAEKVIAEFLEDN